MSTLIYGAPAATAAAEVSADNAATSEANAATSATNAANSASAAQAAMINRVLRYQTKAALKAVAATPGDVSYVNFPVPAYYRFTAGDFSAEVAADTWEAVYFAADGTAATSGAWVLIIDEAIDLRIYGLTAANTVDWMPAINHAWAVHHTLNLQDVTGEIGLTNRINPPSGGRLYGPGSAKLTARAMASAFDLMSGIDTRVNAAADVRIDGLTLHGNSANRPTATAGSGAFVSHARFRCYDVVSREWPRNGWGLDGTATGLCDGTVLEDCRALTNGAAGVSSATAINLAMTRCVLLDNGAENMTWDHDSRNADVTDCRFGKARGGCGIIGIDSKGLFRMNGGLIDGGMSLDQAPGDRNGICANSQDHASPDIVLNGTQIQGCVEAGARLRDRTGTGAFTAGDLTCNGAVFRNNGTDLVIETVSGRVLVDAGTRIESVSVTDPSADNVRFASGHAAFRRRLLANQTITADDQFVPVPFTDRVFDRLTGQNGNAVVLPFGSLWNFRGRLRFTGLNATGAGHVGARVIVNGEVFSFNKDVNRDFAELDFCIEGVTPQAEITVDARVGPGTGSATLELSPATYFSGSNQG